MKSRLRKLNRFVNSLLLAAEKTNSTIERLASSTDEMQQKFSQQQQGINESVAQSLSGFQGNVTEAGTTLQNLLRDVTENLRLQQEHLMQYSRDNMEKSMQSIQQARELLAQSTTEFAGIMEGLAKKQEHDQLVLKQIRPFDGRPYAGYINLVDKGDTSSTSTIQVETQQGIFKYDPEAQAFVRD